MKMKQAMLMIIAGMAAVFFISSAHAADVAKIGVVDLQKIVANSSYGKSAQAEINKKGEELTQDLKKKEGDLTELKQKIEREALVMSQEKREEKEREFRIKVGDLQSLEKKYKKELADLNMKLVGRIQADILKLVEEVGKKEGYLLVFEKREAGVMYAPDALDLSDQITKMYNDQYARENKGN
ncbi:MAG: OmpH family outer membrane protein [Desulfobacterales bacterium]